MMVFMTAAVSIIEYVFLPPCPEDSKDEEIGKFVSNIRESLNMMVFEAASMAFSVSKQHR
jgi:hypothetical protein